MWVMMVMLSLDMVNVDQLMFHMQLNVENSDASKGCK